MSTPSDNDTNDIVERLESAKAGLERIVDEILEPLGSDLRKQVFHLMLGIFSLKEAILVRTDPDVYFGIKRAAKPADESEKVESLKPVSPTEQVVTQGTAARIPLEIQKQKLMKFLAEFGSAYRHTITHITGIPETTLTKLLRGPEFKRIGTGRWAFNVSAKDDKGTQIGFLDVTKTPDTSAPPESKETDSGFFPKSLAAIPEEELKGKIIAHLRERKTSHIKNICTVIPSDSRTVKRLLKGEEFVENKLKPGWFSLKNQTTTD
jgi:hypothetical protein